MRRRTFSISSSFLFRQNLISRLIKRSFTDSNHHARRVLDSIRLSAAKSTKNRTTLLQYFLSFCNLFFSPCSETATPQNVNAARNSAPGSFKSLNYKLLKTTYDSTQRAPKPYRAPSNGGSTVEDGQADKLRDIKRSIQAGCPLRILKLQRNC